MLTHHLTVVITDPQIVSKESARLEALSTICRAIADYSLQNNAMRAQHTGDRFTVAAAATVPDSVSFIAIQAAILEALGLSLRQASVRFICTNSH